MKRRNFVKTISFLPALVIIPKFRTDEEIAKEIVQKFREVIDTHTDEFKRINASYSYRDAAELFLKYPEFTFDLKFSVPFCCVRHYATYLRISKDNKELVYDVYTVKEYEVVERW